jgi:NADPH-dependent ferric siderophore reductase
MEHERLTGDNIARKTVKPTRLDRILYRIFARDLAVVGANDIAPHFRLITLQSDSLRGFSWVPGQKIQVAMGTALVARTYTPIKFDSGSGQFQLIAFAHDAGPGAEWVRSIKPGEVFKVFGPTSSLDLRFAAASLVMVGDETSIALSDCVVKVYFRVW